MTIQHNGTAIEGSDPPQAEASRPRGSADDVQDADLGVLFVHGIGVHEGGSTLRDMGSTFVRHLADKEDGATFTYVDNGDDILADHHLAGRWRLVEANWDEELEVPTFRQTLIWLVLVTPWILQREMLFWPLRGSSGSGLVGSVWTTFSTLRSIRGWARLGTSLVLGPLLQVVLLLLAFLRWVPVVGSAITTILTRVLGDSYQFISNPGATEHMSSVVSDRLEDLASHCESTMLVAHSQGAAVALDALIDRPAPDNFRRLVTLGAGIGKLTALRQLTGRALFLTIWAVLRLVLLGVTILSFAAPSNGSTVIGSIGVVSLFALAVGPMLGTWTGAARLSRLLTRADGLGTRWSWLDLWSRHDLVPDGAMNACENVVGNGLATLRVRNDRRWVRSWATDHVRYFDNDREVLPLLESSAIQCASTTSVHPNATLAWAMLQGMDIEGDKQRIEAALDAVGKVAHEVATWTDANEAMTTLGAASELSLPMRPPVAEPSPHRPGRARTAAWAGAVAAVAATGWLLWSWVSLSSDAPDWATVSRMVAFADGMAPLEGRAGLVALVGLVAGLVAMFNMRSITTRPRRTVVGAGATFAIIAIVAGGLDVVTTIVPVSTLGLGDCYVAWEGTDDDGYLDPDAVRTPCSDAHTTQVVAVLPPRSGLVTEAAVDSILAECAASSTVRDDRPAGGHDVVYALDVEVDEDGTPLPPVFQADMHILCTYVTTVPTWTSVVQD